MDFAALDAARAWLIGAEGEVEQFLEHPFRGAKSPVPVEAGTLSPTGGANMASLNYTVQLDGNTVTSGSEALPGWLGSVAAYLVKAGFTPDLTGAAAVNGTNVVITATLNGITVFTDTIAETGDLKTIDDVITAVTGSHPTFDVSATIVGDVSAPTAATA